MKTFEISWFLTQIDLPKHFGKKINKYWKRPKSEERNHREILLPQLS